MTVSPLDLAPDTIEAPGRPIPAKPPASAPALPLSPTTQVRATAASASNPFALPCSPQLLHIERDGLYVNLSTLTFRPLLLSPRYPKFDLTFDDVTRASGGPTFFLRLGEQMGNGALWTVFEADLVALNVDPLDPCTPELSARVMHRVVVKVTRSGPAMDDYAWCENSALAEAELYAGPLLQAGLVGSTVPKFYGIFKAPLPRLQEDHVLAAVYERVGHQLADEWSMVHPFWM